MELLPFGGVEANDRKCKLRSQGGQLLDKFAFSIQGGKTLFPLDSLVECMMAFSSVDVTTVVATTVSVDSGTRMW